MQRKISLFLKENNPKEFIIEIPEGKIPFSDFLEPLYKLFDHILTIELEGQRISCRKGCNACCVQMIPLGIPEVFYINNVLEALPPGHKKRIRRRFSKNKNLLNNAGLLSRMKNPAECRTLDEEYFNLGLPCPFLEEGICSIYNKRPFICREYNVSSPPGLCRSPYRNPVERAITGLNLGALVAAFAARLYGLATTPVPLAIAQDWAERFDKLEQITRQGIWYWEKLEEALIKEGVIRS